MRILLFALLGLVLSVPAAFAQKAYTGTATGNLTVDGKPIPLKYAYVVDVDNVEEAGLLLSGPQKYQVIVLTDHELPLSSIENRNSPYADLRSPGQIFAPLKKSPVSSCYGLLLKYDPEKKTLFEAEFLYPGLDSPFSVAGADVPDRISGVKQEGKSLSGTVSLPTAHATGRDKAPKKYQYKISFQAPIQAEPAVTQKLEGAEALDSAPVKALRDYLAAAKASDLEKMRALTAETHLPYLKNPEAVKSLKNADMSKLPEQVKRVIIRGNNAVVMVVSEQPNYSQTAMQFVKVKDAWKLYWP